MGLETIFGSGFITSQLNKIINWGRKNSFFPLPFVTACCGMEFMATWGSHYDVARFGAELPRFSPRQSDLLMVVGTINHKIAPVLKRVYDQMCEPKWVIAFGACAASGGFYRNYATVQGHRPHHSGGRVHCGLPTAPGGGAGGADAAAEEG